MGPHIVSTKDTGDGLASSLVRSSIAYSAWSVERGRERFARGESFLSYVKAFLLPTHKPGDIVGMNNLGSRKGKAVYDTIRSGRSARRLFAPAYSRDLNPIAQVIAKLKAVLRKAPARTCEGVSNAIGELPPRFPSRECANYLPNDIGAPAS